MKLRNYQNKKDRAKDTSHENGDKKHKKNNQREKMQKRKPWKCSLKYNKKESKEVREALFFIVPPRRSAPSG